MPAPCPDPPERTSRRDARAWAEPTVIGGDPPPPAGPVATKSLGKAGGCDVPVAGGSRGVPNALISFDCGSRSLGFHGFRVRAAGDALEDAQSAAELVRVAEEPASGRYRVRHSFRNWAGISRAAPNSGWTRTHSGPASGWRTHLRRSPGSRCIWRECRPAHGANEPCASMAGRAM